MDARGIDIQEVFLVIQLGISKRAGGSRPNVVDYQHRAGRAGRFGRPGVCISFITPNDVPLMALIERALKTPIQQLPQSLDNLPHDTPGDAPQGAPRDAAPPEDPAPQ